MSRALHSCLGSVNTWMGSWTLGGPQFTYLCNGKVARPSTVLQF